ncbi:MAG: hypothetical protein J5802_04275 [Butyrivibrio sp.]|nr:hypothetical protein [Butyrivibrio sp.]
MKRLAFREVTAMGASEMLNVENKIKASPKRGEYACKSTHNYVSNLIIVLFCVFINQKNRRHYGK